MPPFHLKNEKIGEREKNARNSRDWSTTFPSFPSPKAHEFYDLPSSSSSFLRGKGERWVVWMGASSFFGFADEALKSIFSLSFGWGKVRGHRGLAGEALFFGKE